MHSSYMDLPGDPNLIQILDRIAMTMAEQNGDNVRPVARSTVIHSAIHHLAEAAAELDINQWQALKRQYLLYRNHSDRVSFIVRQSDMSYLEMIASVIRRDPRLFETLRANKRGNNGLPKRMLVTFSILYQGAQP